MLTNKRKNSKWRPYCNRTPDLMKHNTTSTKRHRQTNMHGVSVKNTTIIVMYNYVPSTCFGPFYLGHHQVGYNC
jgi:hypothetical protein